MKSLALFLLLTLITFSFQKTAIETVNEMGLGWNLGNTFDCYGSWKTMKTPDDQITLWGNAVPTKETILAIKKYGFRTIRLPVTWMNFIDEDGKLDYEWYDRVREAVMWIVETGMYCVLNVQNDGLSGNWLSQGLVYKDKFVSLWKQIASGMRMFSHNFILESMNKVEFKSGNELDYKTLNELNQAFVDTVRATGGVNAERLLLIAGMDADLEKTCSSKFKMPTDKANNLAVSIHYYLPPQFTIESDRNPWTYIDDKGKVQKITPMTTWGTEFDYKEMTKNFERMKKYFVDKGIPVYISEVGVITEEEKDKDSIREFLYAHFSFSKSYDGIKSALWDTSTNTAGDMNYFNRETDEWYDEEIRDNFINISKKNYVNPADYFVKCNNETSSNVSSEGYIKINFENKKVNKVIFNAKIDDTQISEIGFGIGSKNSSGTWFGDPVSGEEGVKQSDGTYTYTIDVSGKDFNDYIQVQGWWGNENILINYVTVEYDEFENTIDYKAYKEAVSKKKLK